MPSLSFQERWAPKILDGSKHQTIRRAGRWKPGMTAHLFTAMRTKRCRRLGRSQVANVVHLQRFGRERWMFVREEYVAGGKPWTLKGPPWRRLEGAMLSEWDVLALAHADGFEAVEEFEGWFDRYPPGEPLDVIVWAALERA
jgi:hypothetical protein